MPDAPGDAPYRLRVTVFRFGLLDRQYELPFEGPPAAQAGVARRFLEDAPGHLLPLGTSSRAPTGRAQVALLRSPARVRVWLRADRAEQWIRQLEVLDASGARLDWFTLERRSAEHGLVHEDVTDPALDPETVPTTWTPEG